MIAKRMTLGVPGLGLGLLLLGSCGPVTPEGSGAPQVVLTVVSNNNLGMVTSAPVGLSCGTACVKTFDVGTTVQLTATVLPDTGATFLGWEGGCTGTEPTCSVTLQTAQQVTAKWQGPSTPPVPPAPTLTRVTPGLGRNDATAAITLQGTGFQTGATVTVGGGACTGPQVVSSTSITCTAPAKAMTCGNQPVVVTNPDNKKATLPTGFRYFTSMVSFGAPAANNTSTKPDRLITVDLNGDGKLDLVSTKTAGGVGIFLGNGDGTFAAEATTLAGAGPAALATVDANGDTYPDLLVVNAVDKTVSYLQGNGAGGFAAAVDTAVGAGPRGLAVGDLNGDKKVDFVVVNNTDSTISVVQGDGEGKFASKTPLTGMGDLQDVVLADFSGDGKLDLVVSNAAGKVAYRQGNGDFTFGAAVEFDAAYATKLAAFDANGDGKLDLVATNYDDGKVSVLIGNGTGGFAAAVSYATDLGSNDLVVADFDGDGVLDLGVTNEVSTDVSILLGKGDGTFLSAVAVDVTGEAHGIVASDFDGNGVTDFVVADLDATTLKLKRGVCK